MPPPEHPKTGIEQPNAEPGGSPKDWHDFTSETTFDVAPPPRVVSYDVEDTRPCLPAVVRLISYFALLYVGLIVAIAVFHDFFGLSAILAFWIAFTLALLGLA